MKKWTLQNKGCKTGAVLGGLAGFLYWKNVGCLTGTCATRSKPRNSTLYFALTGAVLPGSFGKSGSEKTNAADE